MDARRSNTTPGMSQMRWLPVLRDLSSEQTAIINAPFENNMLVYGPAGAGKTVLIAYRAKSLQDQGKQFMVFVYTNELYNFIQAAATDLGIPESRITTFYSWVWGQYHRYIGSPPERQFDTWVDKLIEYFEAHPAQRPKYDYILIDEAQDFKPNVSRLLHIVSPNIFVAGDGAQSLYTDTNDIQDLITCWSPVHQQGKLLKNYRNPRTVAQAASVFLTDPSLNREQFLGMVQGRSSEMKPIWHRVDNSEQQTEMIANIIAQARGQERIGILYPERDPMMNEAERLKQRGVAVKVVENKRGGHDYNNNIPVMMTTYSAKGLEFDWVILPEMNRQPWDRGADRQTKRRQLFVAMTRTKNRLYMISQNGYECGYLREIPANLLQIPQSAAPANKPTPGRPAPPKPVIDDEDLPF